MRHFKFLPAARLAAGACPGRRFPSGFVAAGLMGLTVLAVFILLVLTVL